MDTQRTQEPGLQLRGTVPIFPPNTATGNIFIGIETHSHRSQSSSSHMSRVCITCVLSSKCPFDPGISGLGKWISDIAH